VRPIKKIRMFKNQFYFIIVIGILFTNFVVAQKTTISGIVVDSQNDVTIEYVV
jgi:hypothetical protein